MKPCYDPTGSRGLSKESWRLLPRRCRSRKPRNRITAKPNALGDYKPITQRPIAVEQRCEAGHWEGDLIIGANNASAIITLVERVTRQSVLAALPQRYTAKHSQTHRHSNHRSTITPTQTSRQNSRLGPRTRNSRAGKPSNKPSTSTSTSTNRVHHGNAPATNKPTDYYAAGYPNTPTSTSTQHTSLSSKTTSTTCPANSTTGNSAHNTYTNLSCNHH